MLRIETSATVTGEGTCTLRVPAAVPRGTYRVVLLVGDEASEPAGCGGIAVDDTVGSNAEAQAAAYEAVYRTASARG